MPHAHHGGLESWEFPIALTVALAFMALVYLCGWFRLRPTPSGSMASWRAGSFLLGLCSIWTAVGSPIAAFHHELLTVHMVQHLLLMTIAPPLIYLGEPFTALLHGLPRRVDRATRTLFELPSIHRFGTVVTQPAFCWLAATATLIAWHVPAVLAFGMKSEAWYAIQHVSFLVTGLLFWWPVFLPWPSTSAGPNWSTVLYLFLATLPCDILSGFLVFSERIAYPIYLSSLQHSGLSVIEDQQCAGAVMWTCVTVVYLVAGTILATRLLSPRADLNSLEVL